jgi:hypothetical protein
MADWSLSQLLASLREDIQQRLAIVRKSFNHPGTKGDASESVWIEMLEKYLPRRYQAATAHIVDSLGHFSQQIDVVVFDRQYSPFIFNYQNQTIIPAESLCPGKGRKRSTAPSDQLANPICQGHLPGQAPHSNPWRAPDVRERLESSSRCLVRSGLSGVSACETVLAG